ncbi:hypothetical protein [Brucella pseudintermedia]|uniref:hypothetical protein n=1 Tax=Brucella pseudintermedia TaxID=370111 RepID=UPI0030F3EE37
MKQIFGPPKGDMSKIPEMAIGNLRAMASVFFDRLAGVGRAFFFRPPDGPKSLNR